MNEEYPTASPAISIHVPLMLVALSIAVFLAAQIGAVNRSGKTMEWQLGNLDKQIENLKEAKKQLAELITQRDDLVKQSAQVQQQYTSLLNDVLDLAKDDGDAKKVVEKWGIQRQQPPAGEAKKDEKAEEKK